MKIEEEKIRTWINLLRKQLSEYSKRAFRRGLVSGTGGNLSIRVPDTDQVIITPSGFSLEEIEPEINLLVNLNGSIIKAPEGLKPSKETSFHISIYKIRPDVGAVAHLHPPYATAYSNLGQNLPLVTVSSRAVLGEIPCIECAMPGSKELAEYVIEGVKKYPGIKGLLMKEHGILTLASDIRTAYYLADLIEATAKVAFIENILREKYEMKK